MALPALLLKCRCSSSGLLEKGTLEPIGAPMVRGITRFKSSKPQRNTRQLSRAVLRLVWTIFSRTNRFRRRQHPQPAGDGYEPQDHHQDHQPAERSAGPTAGALAAHNIDASTINRCQHCAVGKALLGERGDDLDIMIVHPDVKQHLIAIGMTQFSGSLGGTVTYATQGVGNPSRYWLFRWFPGD